MNDAYVIATEIVESVLNGIDDINITAENLLKICKKKAWVSVTEVRALAYRIKYLSEFEYMELSDSIAEYIQITEKGLRLLEAPPETE